MEMKSKETYASEHGVQGQDRRQNFVGQGLYHFWREIYLLTKNRFSAQAM